MPDRSQTDTLGCKETDLLGRLGLSARTCGCCPTSLPKHDAHPLPERRLLRSTPRLPSTLLPILSTQDRDLSFSYPGRLRLRGLARTGHVDRRMDGAQMSRPDQPAEIRAREVGRALCEERERDGGRQVKRAGDGLEDLMERAQGRGASSTDCEKMLGGALVDRKRTSSRSV